MILWFIYLKSSKYIIRKTKRIDYDPRIQKIFLTFFKYFLFGLGDRNRYISNFKLQDLIKMKVTLLIPAVRISQVASEQIYNFLTGFKNHKKIQDQNVDKKIIKKHKFLLYLYHTQSRFNFKIVAFNRCRSTFSEKTKHFMDDFLVKAIREDKIAHKFGNSNNLNFPTVWKIASSKKVIVEIGI